MNDRQGHMSTHLWVIQRGEKKESGIKKQTKDQNGWHKFKS